MPEQIIYTGAKRQPEDHRNYQYDEFVAMGAAPAVTIDWEKGYDVRNKIGGAIRRTHQGQTLSCVGEAWRRYVWVKQVIEMVQKYNMSLDLLQIHHPEVVKEISAKAIYSQIRLPRGAAYVGAGGKLIQDWGAVTDELVPTKNPKGETDEQFVSSLDWKTPEIDQQAKILKGKEYRIIRARDNMDLFAQAIIQNDGVVGGVEGQNSRGWLTENPKPPIRNADEIIWGHCVYYPAFGTDALGRFIATPNSWDLWFAKREWKPGDPPGFGWQKLREDYFNLRDQFDPWTYTDIANIPLITLDMLELIKCKEKPEVYAVGKDGQARHIYNEAVFIEGRDAGLWGDWSTVKIVTKAELDAKVKGKSIAFII